MAKLFINVFGAYDDILLDDKLEGKPTLTPKLRLKKFNKKS